MAAPPAGIRVVCDHGHAAEDFTGSQQLEDHVLARLRVPDDLHMARLDQVEPARLIALHEDVAASPVALLDRENRQGVDLKTLVPGTHGTGGH